MSTRLVQHAQLTSPLLLYNRSQQVASEHSAAIGEDSSLPMDSVLDAVSPSEIVWSCLADEEAVMAVYEEICNSDIAGKLFVECSTITPEGTDEVAKKVEAKGGSFVAMPGKEEVSVKKTLADSGYANSLRRTS
jgi:3-hydroxyisobutyrate dehydrogenase-like beta-hydroxyacid dehydrogenase